jgi:hypothetical protein
LVLAILSMRWFLSISSERENGKLFRFSQKVADLLQDKEIKSKKTKKFGTKTNLPGNQINRLISRLTLRIRPLKEKTRVFGLSFLHCKYSSS